MVNYQKASTIIIRYFYQDVATIIAERIICRQQGDLLLRVSYRTELAPQQLFAERRLCMSTVDGYLPRGSDDYYYWLMPSKN